MVVPIWNIGVYIATRMKPITTPKNTIIIGSSNCENASTESSNSSS